MTVVSRTLYEAAWPDQRASLSYHAEQRLRDRGVPIFVIDLLMSYGSESDAGDGCKTLWFDRRAMADMRAEMPSAAWASVRRYADVYLIVESENVITVARRGRRMPRWVRERSF